MCGGGCVRARMLAVLNSIIREMKGKDEKGKRG